MKRHHLFFSFFFFFCFPSIYFNRSVYAWCSLESILDDRLTHFYVIHFMSIIFFLENFIHKKKSNQIIMYPWNVQAIIHNNAIHAFKRTKTTERKRERKNEDKLLWIEIEFERIHKKSVCVCVCTFRFQEHPYNNTWTLCIHFHFLVHTIIQFNIVSVYTLYTGPYQKIPITYIH